MDDTPFATRLAERLRWPIALIGIAVALAVLANLLPWISDQVAGCAAVAVGIMAVTEFICGVFDPKLERAVSVLNAERRALTKQKGGLAQLTGIGLPVGDRLMAAVSFALLALTLYAANVAHRWPATALAFAGFASVGMAAICLMVRGQPTDRFAPPFG